MVGTPNLGVKMEFVDSVVTFNKVAGTGEEFDSRKVALYIGLQLEEMLEKIQALPKIERLNGLLIALEVSSEAFKKGHFDEQVEMIDRVQALDADVDLAVVALGGACALGAQVNEACLEVMSSNLSKYELNEDGSYIVYKDENGKVKKPASYRPPNLEPFVK